MLNTNMHSSEDMIYGAYVGKIKYLLDKIKNDSTMSVEYFDDSVCNLVIMNSIIESINDKKHICPKDMCNRIDNLTKSGSILYAISPLAFADIFGIHHELDDVIMQITKSFTNDKKTQLLCVEYIHLLHDIIWHKINKNDIIKIIPELDVLESELVCSNSDKDIFFAALWSFVFSNNYKSCYDVASNLKNTNSDISGVAGVFAGLYYGVDSIPYDWVKQVFDSFLIDHKSLNIQML